MKYTRVLVLSSMAVVAVALLAFLYVLTCPQEWYHKLS